MEKKRIFKKTKQKKKKMIPEYQYVDTCYRSLLLSRLYQERDFKLQANHVLCKSENQFLQM